MTISLPPGREADYLNTRLSLSQLAQQAEDELQFDCATDADGDIDYDEMIQRLHVQHMKFKLAPRQLSRFVSAVVSLDRKLRDQKIDLRMYLSAQFHALCPRILLARKKNRRASLQPAMLGGRNAMTRYEIYVHASQDRYQSAHTRAFDAKTELNTFLWRCTEDETNIGTLASHNALSGVLMTDDEAANAIRPGPEWIATFRDGRDFPFAVSIRPLMRRAARLTASRNVLNAMLPRLADSTGIREPFRWADLGLFAKRFVVPAHDAVTARHPDLVEFGKFSVDRRQFTV